MRLPFTSKPLVDGARTVTHRDGRAGQAIQKDRPSRRWPNPALEHQFCERNELQILVGRIETSVNTKL